MQTDKRLSWCRENIPSFREAHDDAEEARRETQENRSYIASLIKQGKAQMVGARE